MERRSLQYTDAKSDKFWTITLEGLSHTVQYGRVGTTGQLQTKEFGSEAEAQKSFQKLLQEKLKKGYVELEK
jgi:predicted DNA-binding WGR domain protein